MCVALWILNFLHLSVYVCRFNLNRLQKTISLFFHKKKKHKLVHAMV